MLSMRAMSSCVLLVNPEITRTSSANVMRAIRSSGRAWLTKSLAAALAASIGPPDIEPEASMASTTPTGRVESTKGVTSRSVTGLPFTVISSWDGSRSVGRLRNSMTIVVCPPSG